MEEYKQVHDEQWPEVHDALHTVGIRNLSLWNHGHRLFFYAEYIGEEPYEQAMERYSAMPRVAEWEALMRGKYQQQLPGSEEGVWWQPMRCLFYQA